MKLAAIGVFVVAAAAVAAMGAAVSKQSGLPGKPVPSATASELRGGADYCCPQNFRSKSCDQGACPSRTVYYPVDKFSGTPSTAVGDAYCGGVESCSTYWSSIEACDHGG